MRSAVFVDVVAGCGGPPAVEKPTPPAAAEVGFVTADDGTRLYYRKVGDRPWVAIVHGAAFFGEALDRLAPRHTIVLYDLRNRGRSGKVPLERVSITNDLADLESVRAQVATATGASVTPVPVASAA